MSTLVLANDDPCKMFLLSKVLTRAAMCKALAENEFKANADEAFMVGMLSMADLMLGQPIQKVCEHMPLQQESVDALIRHNGKLGSILTLVKTFEKAGLHSANGNTVDELNTYYRDSRSWAMTMLAGLYD